MANAKNSSFVRNIHKGIVHAGTNRLLYIIPDTTSSPPGTTTAAAGDTGGTRRGSGDCRGEGTEPALPLLLLPMEVVEEKLRSDGLGGGTSLFVRSRKVSGEMTCAAPRLRGGNNAGRGKRWEGEGKARETDVKNVRSTANGSRLRGKKVYYIVAPKSRSRASKPRVFRVSTHARCCHCTASAVMYQGNSYLV